jgi:hypothetical protein
VAVCGMQAVDTSQDETLISQEAASYGDYARKGAFHGIARDLLGLAISNWKVAPARSSPAINVPHQEPCRAAHGKTVAGLNPQSSHKTQTSTDMEPHKPAFAKMEGQSSRSHGLFQQHFASEIPSFPASSGKGVATVGSLAPHDVVSAMPTNREWLVAVTAEMRQVCNCHVWKLVSLCPY